MAAQAGSIEFIGKVTLDASELMKALGMGGKVTGGGGGPVSGSGSDEEQAKVIQKGMRKSYKDPSFMSIFRPLVALEGLKGLVANSRVTNAYLGGMGKMFSAAIDLLLLPFTPLFNLLMIGLSKLIGWLIDSGVLKAMGEGVQELINLFGGVAKWVAEMASAIVNLDFSKIGSLIVEAFKAVGKLIIDAIKDPLGAAKTVGKMALAGAGIIGLGAMMPGPVGGITRGLIGAGAGAVGGLFGLGGGKGGGKTPPIPPPAGGGVSGGGGGRGGMGRMMGGSLLFGGGMMLGQATGSSILGMGGMGAGIGMMAGGPLGALAGAGIGAGMGLLDKKLLGGKLGGFLGMGGGGGGGGGGKTADKIVNIGTQNNSFNIKVEDPKAAKEILKDAEEKAVQSAMS